MHGARTHRHEDHSASTCICGAMCVAHEVEWRTTMGSWSCCSWIVWQCDRDANRKAGFFTEIIEMLNKHIAALKALSVCALFFFSNILLGCFASFIWFAATLNSTERAEKTCIHHWFPVAFHPLVWVGYDGEDSDRWYFPFCLASIASLFLCLPDASEHSLYRYFNFSPVLWARSMQCTPLPQRRCCTDW